jgi:hypothetical protein
MSIDISPTKPKIIGLTGVAKCGKDTFFNAFESLHPDKKIVRLSIADIIRTELEKFVYDNTGIIIWDCSPKEKESIRPLMAWYGDFKRKQTEGQYFLDKLDQEIYTWYRNTDVIVITDIRFKEFEFDEPDWIKKYNGTLVHIQRMEPNGIFIKPANELEKKNDPILKQIANVKITWNTFLHVNWNIIPQAQEFVKKLELL